MDFITLEIHTTIHWITSQSTSWSYHHHHIIIGYYMGFWEFISFIIHAIPSNYGTVHLWNVWKFMEIQWNSSWKSIQSIGSIGQFQATVHFRQRMVQAAVPRDSAACGSPSQPPSRRCNLPLVSSPKREANETKEGEMPWGKHGEKM